jgi:hypothetical protein
MKKITVIIQKSKIGKESERLPILRLIERLYVHGSNFRHILKFYL